MARQRQEAAGAGKDGDELRHAQARRALQLPRLVIELHRRRGRRGNQPIGHGHRRHARRRARNGVWPVCAAATAVALLLTTSTVYKKHIKPNQNQKDGISCQNDGQEVMSVGPEELHVPFVVPVVLLAVVVK